MQGQLIKTSDVVPLAKPRVNCVHLKVKPRTPDRISPGNTKTPIPSTRWQVWTNSLFQDYWQKKFKANCVLFCHLRAEWEKNDFFKTFNLRAECVKGSAH